MTTKAKYLVAAVTITVAIIAVATVTGRSPQATKTMSMATSSSQAVKTDHVTIQNYMFDPMVIKVKAGTTVTWTNDDAVHHSVSADTASSNAPNGPLIGHGEQYQFKFTKAGTYSFHCNPHPYMHGTVIVTD